jgi:type III pantothenate kinase
MKESILVIDIGNTSTSLGLFERNKITSVVRIEKVNQEVASICSAMRKAAGKNRIAGVCIASVVPGLNAVWQQACRALFDREPLMVSHKLELGIPVTYPKPESIGADRLANAVGGVRKFGAPLIVADFGTAVTFDVVTKRSGYAGGIIAPGLPLMFDYLAERTAQLPRVTWKPIKGRVGKSTADAMQIGAHWGYRGMVREIMTELKKDPSMKNATICATGGFAAKVLSGINPKPVIEPTLTLYGIGCIYELNR